MASWNAVSREDLLTWASSDGAPSALPELIRQLVLETGAGIETVDFPGGSGVSGSGVDGFVRAAHGTAFVPSGASVWELSVDKGAANKASTDLLKRDQVPDGSPMDQAVFMQVICRPWTKSREFARERSRDGKWREVRGYNVDRLVTWLEQAPATRLRFLERIARPMDGLYSGAEWWDRWASKTEPTLTPAVVLARNGVDDLKAALHRPGITTVAGPIGADELVACVVASAVREATDSLARMVIVDDRIALERLLKERTPLVIVVADSSLAHDVVTQHSVLIPVPQSDAGDVLLGPVNGEAVVSALRALQTAVARDIGLLARRSFVAFRRRLAKRPELMTPKWSLGGIPRSVRAAVMLTSWDDRSSFDRQVLAAMIDRSYEDAREELLAHTHGDDPLLALTDGTWHVVSPVDAWQSVGRHLLPDDLQRFLTQAQVVLSERDPALDLPREDRWRANFEGKEFTHSGSLRVGVASGLALLATFGEAVQAGTGMPGERWTARLLRPILATANNDGTGERWSSIAPLLPLLIEAAPTDVLDALRKGTTNQGPVLARIFQDDPNERGFSDTSSPHTHFLWALETVAWSSEYLGEAAALLAALASLDPGGRTVNRPTTSLEHIFSPWHPDTAADPAQRLAVLDRLRGRWPDVAWALMISMLPSAHGVHLGTSEPKFRDWKPEQNPVLVRDYWAIVEQLLDRLLADVGIDDERWTALLEEHTHLPPHLRSKVRKTFAALDRDAFARDARRMIWESLTRLIAHHREYADTEWALPAEELVTLESAVAAIAPSQAADIHRWLFADHWVEIGDIRRREDHRAYDEEVAARRARAIAEVVSEGSIEDVVSFARHVRPDVVGIALANAFEDTYVPLMLEWSESEEPRRLLGASYLWRRCRVGGLSWVLSTLEDHPGLSPKIQAQLLHDVDDFRGGYDEARRRGEDVEHQYWKAFVHFGRGADFPDVVFVARQLVSVGRNAAALDLLGLYARQTTDVEFAEAVLTALEAYVEAGGNDPETRLLKEWDFKRFFQVLDEHVDELGLARVTAIQWYFFPVLGYDPPTTTLHRHLAEDPSFFVEIISLAFRRHSRDEDPQSPPRDQNVAQNAFRLLRSWSVPPGQDVAGNFDIDRCRRWIDEALSLLIGADRVEIGKQQIGEVLTYTPEGPAGWPSDQVAVLIDTLDDDGIDTGIEVRIHNRRGVTTRGMTEGGEQERQLAAKYRERAQQFRDSHPRVAGILRRLADSYDAQALRHDSEAERRQRGLEG